MRILLFVLLLCLLYSCENGKLRIPPQPAILGLASPVYLQSDTTIVRLADYFPKPEQIKKVTLPKGMESEETNDKSILKLRINGPGNLLQNLRIRYEGYNYDIPVFREMPVTSSDSGVRIMTDKLKGDTIYLLSSVPAVHWAVYLQNYKLSDKALLVSGDRLGIIIPKEIFQLQWAELRVWAFNENGVSNDVLVPIQKGQVVTDVSELLMVNHSGADFRPQYPLNTGNNDYAASVFAFPDKSFRQLHDSLTDEFRRYGVHRNSPRVSEVQDRFFANAEKAGLNIDTVYNRWIQLLVFNATVPGMFLVDDQAEFKNISADGSELSPEDLMVWEKCEALNLLRHSDIALIYGDFIPLRVEDQVYAYLRSYFGKDVVVVFNKARESITLKLDLPRIERNNEFKSLFDGRFSYDNSKMILDVSADGVEVIYN